MMSEENHGNLRGLVGGCVLWHLKKLYIGNSEENHENLREIDAVHWHLKKAYISNLF
jgi:hypothetical protein